MEVALSLIDGLRISHKDAICAAIKPDSGWDPGSEQAAEIADKISTASADAPGVVAMVSKNNPDDPTAFFSGHSGELLLVVVTEKDGNHYVVNWSESLAATEAPSPQVESLNIGEPHDV